MIQTTGGLLRLRLRRPRAGMNFMRPATITPNSLLRLRPPSAAGAVAYLLVGGLTGTSVATCVSWLEHAASVKGNMKRIRLVSVAIVILRRDDPGWGASEVSCQIRIEG